MSPAHSSALSCTGVRLGEGLLDRASWCRGHIHVVYDSTAASDRVTRAMRCLFSYGFRSLCLPFRKARQMLWCAILRPERGWAAPWFGGGQVVGRPRQYCMGRGTWCEPRYNEHKKPMMSCSLPATIASISLARIPSYTTCDDHHGLRIQDQGPGHLHRRRC